jgi:diguanylate cyclase (GGDEF)-like protein
MVKHRTSHFQAGLNNFSKPDSLEKRLLAWTHALIIAVLLIIGLSFGFLIFRSEKVFQQSSLSLAANSLAQTAASTLMRITDNLGLVSSVDRDILQANPQMMQNLLFQNPDLLEIVRLDSNGRVITYVSHGHPEIATLTTIVQSQWFIRAKSGFSYQDIQGISSQFEPEIIISLPAASGDILAARLRLDVLRAAIVDSHLIGSKEAYITTRAGEIIANSQIQFVPVITNIRERKEFSAVMNSLGKNWYGSYVNYEGKSVLGSAEPIPGTPWILFVESMHQDTYAMTQLAMITLVALILISSVFIHRIVRRNLEQILFGPLEKLRVVAERIGQGDLGIRINLPQEDEIGQVARAMDLMAEHLRDREIQLRNQSCALANEIRERKKVAEDLRKLSRELEMRVQERTAELIYEIDSRKKIEVELFYQSTHDSLTALYNRHFYVEEMNRLESSRQFPISLVMVDIDNLKMINDNLGHSIGDEYLCRTATLLKGVFRSEDIVARIGGDEFAILLPNTDLMGVAKAVERIKRQLQAQAEVAGPPFLSLSIGAETAQPGDHLELVFKRADKKMYQDKQSRRNKISVMSGVN